MIELFLGLFLAHIISDFVLFPQKWREEVALKSIRSRQFWIHLGIVLLALVFFFMLPQMYGKTEVDTGLIPIALIYLLCHALLDGLQAPFYTKANERTLFAVNQITQGMVILTLVAFYYRSRLLAVDILGSELLLLVVAVLTLTVVLSFIIGMMLSRWRKELEGKYNSVLQGGKYIGMTERLLVFGFAILGNWLLIGFLLLAKAIFRFTDLYHSKDRLLTQYVLLGTMLSFLSALLVSYLFRILLFALSG